MKIALIGYGKMGKEIENIALERGHEIVLKSTSKTPQEEIAQKLLLADVAIEFSTPKSAVKNIYICFETNTPVVIGTTGWYDQYNEVKETCLKTNSTMLAATNCSLGVNIFFEINKYLAKMMNNQPQYNVAVEEIHHIHKLDAPSGTAISIAEQIIENLDRKKHWKNELSENTEDLEIISIREGEVPGTHKVVYSSDIDDIEIMHKAHNRKGFAQGAVVAAEFIAGKKGIFTMKDVLGL
ncbi:MAG TPA: 4-hydroxy-tetrahydrodipicolinate reductase [Flavobacteriales bacterium]|nr:4-hydroxy-tetrahydrodipicolinate reductase [Flavobacteriales bacterium]|tara:strand:- start:2668 stop:3384 length:717 start_codon:yes stop_codon:yes gene_type:complete